MAVKSTTRLRGIIWVAVSTTTQANEDEKQSMVTQEADLRAFFEKENIEIIDVLRVPGHSRNYKSLDKLAEHARAEGLDAFDKLKHYLEHGGFDVVGVRDANRFARRASLLHFIAESIVEDCNARIYSLSDGWVDSSNVDVWAMVKGYETNKQRKWISGEMQRGKDKVAQRGLPTGSGVPISHQVERDPKTGKALRLVVDESKRPLFAAVADLILEGVSWLKIENELYIRYGYVNPTTGNPYSSGRFYRLVTGAPFWGHTARHYRTLDHPNKERLMLCVIDDSYPVPDGVQFYKDTHEAMWTGELAAAIKSEIMRRSLVAHGRARPQITNRFSGLFVCGGCGYLMSTRSMKGKHHRTYTYHGMYCSSRVALFNRPRCTNRSFISERKLQVYINSLLEQALDYTDLNQLLQTEQPAIHHETTITIIAQNIAELEQQVRNAIREQIRLPESEQRYYREEVDVLHHQITGLQAQMADLERQAATVNRVSQNQHDAFEIIKAQGLEAFWASESRRINQVLFRLMGNRRFVIDNKQIIGTIEWQGKKQPSRG